MAKSKVVYEEQSVLVAKFNHPKSDDYLDYKAKVRIKDSGKTPVHLFLKFDGIPPFIAPMPPEEHTIKAKFGKKVRETTVQIESGHAYDIKIDGKKKKIVVKKKK